MFINNSGHMIKMSTMSMYGKKKLQIFSGTAEPIAMKLYMKQFGIE